MERDQTAAKTPQTQQAPEQDETTSEAITEPTQRHTPPSAFHKLVVQSRKVNMSDRHTDPGYKLEPSCVLQAQERKRSDAEKVNGISARDA